MLKPPTDKISSQTRQRLLELADFIEADQEHGFYMGTYFSVNPYYTRTCADRPECGTAGCIAGFCALMLLGSPNPHTLPWDTFSKRLNDSQPAHEYLDLNENQEWRLFYGSRTNNRAEAVRVLRNFAYTGEIDWRE